MPSFAEEIFPLCFKLLELMSKKRFRFERKAGPRISIIVVGWFECRTDKRIPAFERATGLFCYIQYQPSDDASPEAWIAE
jgi:hypothetical protein